MGGRVPRRALADVAEQLGQLRRARALTRPPRGHRKQQTAAASAGQFKITKHRG
jgi:hypothetical protein